MLFAGCRICGMTLPAEQFSNDRTKKFGIRSACKPCDKSRSLKWQRDNPDRVNAKNAVWIRKNRHISRAGHTRWRLKHPEYDAERKKKWFADNPHKIKQRNMRARSTVKGKLEDSIRRGVSATISKGSKRGRQTFALLGYSYEELRDHLEGLFTSGMSWDNYGRNGWHIDHKVPLSVHNYDSPDHIDFKRAWALTNLQPLWERDNMRKSAKLISPFQPSFAI